jgi:hypothetical protein
VKLLCFLLGLLPFALWARLQLWADSEAYDRQTAILNGEEGEC